MDDAMTPLQEDEAKQPTTTSTITATVDPGIEATASTLEAFSETVEYLWCRGSSTTIPILDNPPTPLEFARDFAGPSRPCIIRNAIVDHSKGIPLIMTLDDILQHLYEDQKLKIPSNKAKEEEEENETTGKTTRQQTKEDRIKEVAKSIHLTVDVTPDGHGDCVRTVMFSSNKTNNVNDKDRNQFKTTTEEIFVEPKQIKMSLLEFRDLLRQQEQQSQLADGQNEHEDSDPGSGLSKFDLYGRKLVHSSSIVCSNNASTIDVEGDHKAKALVPEFTPTNPPSQQLPPDSIVYYSQQNDCLRDKDELGGDDHLGSALLQDTLFPPTGLDWAQSVFQSNLEAVNLWIGNASSVSSMHKDHYENLFYVASGEKIFTICPPSDVPFLYEHCDYPPGVFEVMTENENDNGSSSTPGSSPAGFTWAVKKGPDSENKVRWIAPDVSMLLSSPSSSSQRRRLLERHPLLRHTHVQEVRVRAGELLYLPALWFHRVTQSCETIGINYWYDMNFESPLWCYFSLLQQMHPSTSGVVPSSRFDNDNGDHEDHDDEGLHNEAHKDGKAR